MKSGFVAVVGRPNVGKSTLVNALVGSKVAITSPRPQTTRNTIRGVLHAPDLQIVFVDTPGLHKPRKALGKRLNRLVHGTLQDVDAAVMVVDARGGIGPGDRMVAERVREAGLATVVAVNKVDAADQAQVVEALAEAGDWELAAYCPVSALHGEGVGCIVEELGSRLEEGPAHFPEGMVTDQPEELLITEIIREKFLSRLREELPHSLVVVLEDSEERHGGLLYLAARLVVERESQKGMVIGKGGRLLRDAGAEARQELERLFGAKVFLDLRVRVERNWQDREAMLDRLGW